MQKIGENVQRGLMRLGLLGTVLSVLAFGGGRVEAAPVLSIDYSGTVDVVYGPGGGPDVATGLHIGDLIVGTLTIDPVVESYTSTTETETTPPGPPVTTMRHAFAETGKFTFGLAGSPIEVDGASGHITHALNDYVAGSSILFDFANGGDLLQFEASDIQSTTPLMTLLTQLPADSSGLGAFLGGFLQTTNSLIRYHGTLVQFTLNAGPFIAHTPIPPSLLLFVTACGGLGFIGYRRQRNA